MQIIAESQEPLLYTMAAAAGMLSVSESTLRRWVSNGTLKTVRPSVGTVRISRAELERFVKEASDGPCERVDVGGLHDPQQ